jgi:hypothetical protein
MATTTNYGWTTPDDTALVKDGAAAIRTLGSSVDTTTKALNPETTLGDIAYRSSTANVKTRLGLGTAGQVLRVNSGATAPEWATTADQTPLTTKGDLFGFDTADARIPIGTNGHILTADSTQSLGLKWAAPAGGGKVLQVVSAVYSTEVSITGAPFADTGLTLSITPTSATSKIWVVISQLCHGERTTDNASAGLRLQRDGTTIHTVSDYYAAWVNKAGAGNTQVAASASLTYLDSPATTSAVTYKTQFANRTAAASVSVQLNAAQSTIIACEISA